METFLVNAVGKLRRETLNGRVYLVAPLTMIVGDSVLNGSQGALFYPAQEVVKNVEDWNGIPIVENHPKDKSGVEVSARDPDILQRYYLGNVFRSTVADEKNLAGEAWFDVQVLRKRNQRLLTRLLKSEPVEISTGLFTRNETVPPGSKTPDGVAYEAVAYDYKPDHLAVLPDDIGACSVKDGCGLFVGNKKPYSLAQLRLRTDSYLLNCGGPGSGVPGPCPLTTPKKGTGKKKKAEATEEGKDDKTTRRGDSPKTTQTTGEVANPHKLPFVNSGGANKELPDKTRDYLKTASKEEIQAVHDYTGGASFRINTALREGVEPGGSMKPIHEKMQKVFKDNPDLPEPVTVYRGMSMGPERAKAFVDGLEQAKKDGKPFVSDGYVSTTTKQDDVKGAPIEMTIKAKNGIDTRPVTRSDPNEMEMLLGAGSKYKVGKISKTENGYHVELEQLPKGTNNKSSLPLHYLLSLTNSYLLNCGGPGSGVPGPCPMNKPQQKAGDNSSGTSNEPKKLGSVSEAEKYGESNYKEWEGKISGDERKALEGYSGGSYENINVPLRQGKMPEGRGKEIVEKVDSALAKGSTPEAVTVHRGMRGDVDDPNSPVKQMVKAAETQGTFEDKAYMSTSLSKKVVDQSFSGQTRQGIEKATVEIDVPKGHKGAYIDNVTQAGEAEFLLPRGTKLKVKSAVKDENGVYRIKAEIVADTSSSSSGSTSGIAGVSPTPAPVQAASTTTSTPTKKKGFFGGLFGNKKQKLTLAQLRQLVLS